MWNGVRVLTVDQRIDEPVAARLHGAGRLRQVGHDEPALVVGDHDAHELRRLVAVSAMTRTPASAPRSLVTTPPMSS
jgi:hypothetical protein